MKEDKPIKKKIVKTCENCALLKHDLCAKPDKKCSRWVNKKRTCINCEFAHSCILLGKNHPSCFGFCASFKKRKEKNPIDIFPDAAEYKLHKEERALLKEEKKKGKGAKLAAKKDVGKIELLDRETPTPLKGPKIKVAKKKKQLDPTLQDKDRSEWSPMDKIEEIVSRNYDPEAFALVDERDLPKSDNIIKFILEPEFLNQPLYPRQLQICLDFFNAYCPFCSDTKWIRNGIQVDEKVENILDKAVLYSNGVCPKCGKTKYDAIKEKAQTLYTSLNLAVGQRCITGTSRVLTSNGIERLRNIAKDKPIGKSEDSRYVGIETGALAKTSHFYSFKPEKVYELKTYNGLYVQGTKDHPVLTLEGYKTLKCVSDILDKGNRVYLPVYYGQNIYGKSPLNLTKINEKVFEKYEKYRFGLFGSKKIRNNIRVTLTKVDEGIATLLGLFVAEGHGPMITNYDSKVAKFCAEQMERLYPGGVKIYKKGHFVGVRYRPNQHHFNILVQGQCGVASEYKFIPDHILSSPKSIQASFLRGMFEGDGYVEGNEVKYVSISKKLTYDISAILSNMGIIHRITSRWTWATNGTPEQVSKKAYFIDICGSECAKYKKYIGFMSKRKNAALDEIVNFYNVYRTNRLSFWWEKYPDSVKRWLMEYREEIREFVKHTYAWHSYTNPRNDVPSSYVRNLWPGNVFPRSLNNDLVLNKRMVEDMDKAFRESLLWQLLPHELKKKWIQKYDELHENVYYVEVKSCNKMKKKRRTYDFEIPYHHRFVANGLVNHNSGKTSLIWMISPAIIHEYLQIPNPAKFMRQLDVTEFHATFVGVTAEDAYKNVWSPMDNVFTWSPWYRMYHQFLDEEGKRIGTELYKHLDTFITYHHKGIYASSGNADYRRLRGKTRIIGGIDEGSYLTGDKILMNAWQTYDALNNSLSTLQTAHEKIFPRFPWAPTAYGLYTSSTRSKQDFIMGMHKRARRVPSIYSRKMATWEFNPNMPRDCDFIKSKYLEDYAAAERDYASNPPFASDPFIRKASMIVPILSNRSNVLAIDKIKITKDSLGGRALYPTIRCIPHNYPCVLSVDAGYKKNSFAIALTHRIPVKDDPESYLLATSGLLEIAPREGIPISYSKVYDEVICKIIEKFNVVLFATDQWQGIDLQSRVYNDFEIDALQYSVSYDDFELLRTNISSETWELPKLDGELKEVLAMEKDLDELVYKKPVSHLMLQLLLSKDTGKAVVKNTDAGEDFTDDLLRAAVLGVSLVENEEYAYLFETEGRFGIYKGPMGAVASFTGGGGRTSVPGLGASAKFRT